MSRTKRRAREHLKNVTGDVAARFSRLSEEHGQQKRRIAELEEALRAPPLEGVRKPPPAGESFVQVGLALRRRVWRRSAEVLSIAMRCSPPPYSEGTNASGCACGHARQTRHTPS